MVKIVLVMWLTFMAGVAMAQNSAYTPLPVSGVENAYQVTALLPASAALITNQSAYLGAVTLTNTSASAVTITLKDTAGCGGSGCTWISPSASLAAGATIILDFKDTYMTGGFVWSASIAGVVSASAIWRY
jgi:hypothetical protein